MIQDLLLQKTERMLTKFVTHPISETQQIKKYDPKIFDPKILK